MPQIAKSVNPWLRLHRSVRHCPKIVRLNDRLFRTWVLLITIASDEDGSLPSIADLACELRQPEKDVQDQVNDLIERGLIDVVKVRLSGSDLALHDWGAWQFKSDISTERSRLCRARKRAAQPVEKNNQQSDATLHATECNVAATVPDTETDKKNIHPISISEVGAARASDGDGALRADGRSTSSRDDGGGRTASPARSAPPRREAQGLGEGVPSGTARQDRGAEPVGSVLARVLSRPAPIGRGGLSTEAMNRAQDLYPGWRIGELVGVFNRWTAKSEPVDFEAAFFAWLPRYVAGKRPNDFAPKRRART